GREADRLRGRNFGVAFADDFGPATDHCRLNEPESFEGRPCDVADELAARPGIAAPGFIIVGFGTRGLRHLNRPCHSAFILASAAERLLTHYDRHARALPWRSPPGSAPPDPYIVWLSEVMLQQTTVATVKPRFRRFLERWPTIEALAVAPDEE